MILKPNEKLDVVELLKDLDKYDREDVNGFERKSRRSAFRSV